jgi:RNase H-like domain found in reverse transcriptase
MEEDELVPLTDDFISSVCQDIHNRFPKVKRKRLSREEIKQQCHLQVPEEFQERYMDIMCKHQDTLSIDKYDLGLAKDFKHKIHLKMQDPVYRKQFKIQEAHHQFIDQTLDEWLKLGVVKRSNSPIFCAPKKQGQGLRIVQDFRELNQNSHIDKYAMKEITECIFTTLDLTSGFWQMQLDEDSQKLTAFTIQGKGQLHWITSQMGLLGCPASFQRLMEGVLTDTQEKHLEVLDQVLSGLHKNHLKINLEKCVFGNKEVSYLGFTLTPEGIKPGKNKLKAIKDARPPTDIKTIRSFVGLCNFFWTHIKNFALIATPLFRLTHKDSGYKSEPLPDKAFKAFYILQKQLTSEPVMAFPKADRQYALITDAATGMADTPGGLGANLTQVDKEGNFLAISFSSRQLKDHEKNYSPFLLEAAAAVWGMDFFNKYLDSSCIRTTSLWRNLVTCTVKFYTDVKQPYWSMTLLFSTKRVPTCWQTIFPDFRAPKKL